jgi:hypothetical protein
MTEVIFQKTPQEMSTVDAKCTYRHLPTRNVSLETFLIFVLLLCTTERRKEYGIRMGSRIEERE